jgi:hypothetical protein
MKLRPHACARDGFYRAVSSRDTFSTAAMMTPEAAAEARKPLLAPV